jgi:tRNA modification GTPase
MGSDRKVTAWLTTPNEAGAVSILHLSGDVKEILRSLTGLHEWRAGGMVLAAIDGIRDILCAMPAEDVALIMPQGGVRVVQRLAAAVQSRGVEVRTPRASPARVLFPEAGSAAEAMMLHALARAASPLAIDLLLQKGRIAVPGSAITDEDRQRSKRLNRLIDPPLVVLAGAPNVGKSTLSNALAGRSLSIAMDLAGTTRDYTMARINVGGLVVNWADTPGRRNLATDSIERAAIEITDRLIAAADLLIALADSDSPWPELKAHLHVGSKADLKRRPEADLCVSALTGEGIEDLARLVRESLVPQRDLDRSGSWLLDNVVARPSPPPAAANAGHSEREQH